MQRAKEKYFATKEGKFQAGNPTTGQPATAPGPEWMNAVQEELCGVIEGAGITLNDNNNGQLKSAIEKMISTLKTVLETEISKKEDAIEYVTFVNEDSPNPSVTPNPWQAWQFSDKWKVGQVKRVEMTNAPRTGSGIIICDSTSGSYRNVFFYKDAFRTFRCVGTATIGNQGYAVLKVECVNEA